MADKNGQAITGPTWDTSYGQASFPESSDETLMLTDRSEKWLSSERLYPAADLDGCRDPQRSVNPTEELGG